MSLKESLADLKSAAALLHDKVRLSAVSSHFSWLNDDELLIRKEPCQINLKKTPNAAERDDKAAQLGGQRLRKYSKFSRKSQKSLDYVTWIVACTCCYMWMGIKVSASEKYKY